MGTVGDFPGVKQPGRKADHRPPSRAEVKNAWSYNSIPLHGVVLEHKDNFTYHIHSCV